MRSWISTRLRNKFLLYFLLIGLVPLLTVLVYVFRSTTSSLKNRAFEHLTSVREIKKRKVEEHFGKLENEVRFFAGNPLITEAYQALNSAFQSLKEEQVPVEFYQELADYYRYDFASKLSTSAKNQVDIHSVIPTDYKTVFYQNHYLSDWKNDTVIGHPYHAVHALYNPRLGNMLGKFAYYDIFIVDNASGYVVYNVSKEIDYGINLLNGSFANTSLGRLFRDLRQSGSPDIVKFYDFEPHVPSYMSPSCFMGAPIFIDGKNVGSIILQLSIHKIDAIMTSEENWQEEGLGRTGETFIVGSDFKMRNDSRGWLEASKLHRNHEEYLKSLTGLEDPEAIDLIRAHQTTILFKTVNTLAVQEALKGKSDTRLITNERGQLALSSYTPLHISNLNWVLVAEIDEAEIFEDLHRMQTVLLLLLIGFVIGIIALALFIANRITSPVIELVNGTTALANDQFEVEVHVNTNDEIKVLADAFMLMAHKLKTKRDEIIAKSIALQQQNEEIQTQRDNLIMLNEDLNQKTEEIEAQRDALLEMNERVSHQKEELATQRDILEQNAKLLREKNKAIMASINYAKRIQEAMLPYEERIAGSFANFFVLFRPRDIVSGDFYWHQEKNGRHIIAAVDCTGHGVPGAFMSMIGDAILTQIVIDRDITEPDHILNEMHKGIRKSLKQDEGGNRDGMDLALCVYDPDKQTLSFAGAKNSLIFIQDGKLYEIKGDKFPIGGMQKEKQRLFSKHILDVSAPLTFYLCSDGFADQFGGPYGQKFMSKNLKKLLLGIHQKPMHEQRELLQQVFENWIGEDYAQLDDVLIMGIKVGGNATVSKLNGHVHEMTIAEADIQEQV